MFGMNSQHFFHVDRNNFILFCWQNLLQVGLTSNLIFFENLIPKFTTDSQLHSNLDTAKLPTPEDNIHLHTIICSLPCFTALHKICACSSAFAYSIHSSFRQKKLDELNLHSFAKNRLSFLSTDVYCGLCDYGNLFPWGLFVWFSEDFLVRKFSTSLPKAESLKWGFSRIFSTIQRVSLSLDMIQVWAVFFAVPCATRFS